MEFALFFIVVLLVGALLYLQTKLQENVIRPYLATSGITEGFEDIPGAVQEAGGVIKWMDNKELYDSFYAGLYDQLTQGSVRTQAEVGLMLHEWTTQGEDKNGFEILDAGCGTGIACAALAKMDVKKVVGLDLSKAMLNQAKTVVIPQSTLTPEQKEKIEWREADLMNPSACGGGEFNHACLLYFTVYYFTDKETLFRNLFYWTRPGGSLIVHVVNKHKFDPMLESATPWMGFSLQKYTDKRVTKSEVTFNNFKYTGDFQLQDPGAEFMETFRFNDGKVRRQRHTFRMEDINTIVGYAKAAGWKYKGFIDMTPLSFEYSYLLHFSRV